MSLPPQRRVRQTLVFAQEPHFYGAQYPTVSYVFNEVAPRFTRRSVIADVVSDARYKPVDHYHSVHVSHVHSAGWVNFDGAQITPISRWIPVPLHESFPAEVRLPLVPSGVVALCVDRAFLALSEQVPTEVNLYNFGWELREIGSLLPRIADGLSRTVSGQYLTLQFGWKPMAADLKSLGSILKTVEKRLAYLRETWGKRVRVGYFEKVNVDISRSPRTVCSMAHGKWDTNLTPIDYACQFRAGGFLYHELERLSGVEGTLRAASSALGLLDPVEAVWNAIPFSFVLDWFGRIGNVLSRLDRLQPFSGLWEISDVGYSISERLTCRVEYEVETSSGKTIAGLGTLTQRLYKRYVGLPVNPTHLIGTGTLTSSQQVLSVALLNSTRRH